MMKKSLTIAPIEVKTVPYKKEESLKTVFVSSERFR
jgi:hypothetical protein